MRDPQDDFHKKFLGRRGERRAERYLRLRGYRLLARNYTTPFGEADLVLKKGKLIVFCEVKTRENEEYGFGREAVDAAKRARYGRIAEAFLVREGYADRQARFDVVEIQRGKVTHIPNAFILMD